MFLQYAKMPGSKLYHYNNTIYLGIKYFQFLLLLLLLLLLSLLLLLLLLLFPPESLRFFVPSLCSGGVVMTKTYFHISMTLLLGGIALMQHYPRCCWLSGEKQEADCG